MFWLNDRDLVQNKHHIQQCFNMISFGNNGGDSTNQLHQRKFLLGCIDIVMKIKILLSPVFVSGQEAYVPTSNLNGAPDLRRALSLLSSDAWCPASTTQSDMIQLASPDLIAASHLRVQAANSAPDCWQDDSSLAEQALPFNSHSNGTHFQNLQLTKAPFESSFFETNQVFSKSEGHFLEFKT